MNIALLIDADNASHCIVNDILKEVSNRGRVTIKRAYGDFMKNCCLNPWIDKLKLNSIEVKQNFNHSIGKNSTDIALVIDAMDIMHNNTVQGFCIVSSDSDFTHLAYRIRSQGFFCMGVGRYTTLPAFKDACDEFLFTENITQVRPALSELPIIEKESPKLPGLKIIGKIDPALLRSDLHRDTKSIDIKKQATTFIDKSLFKNAFEKVCNQSGQAYLSKFAEEINRIQPTFSPKLYGYRSYSQLFSSMPDLFNLTVDSDGMTYKVTLC